MGGKIPFGVFGCSWSCSQSDQWSSGRQGKINHIGSLSAAINQPQMMMPEAVRHMVRRNGIGAREAGSVKSQFNQLTREPLVISLTSLSLNFLICKMGMPTSHSCQKDYKRQCKWNVQKLIIILCISGFKALSPKIKKDEKDVPDGISHHLES